MRPARSPIKHALTFKFNAETDASWYINIMAEAKL